jgi:hypothetical protein
MTASPFPEDYKTRGVYKGINIYTPTPNRYPYMYDVQPFDSAYQCCSSDPRQIFGPRITPIAFPYRNRPWLDYTVYSKKPIVYQSLLDDRDLRPAYVFYDSKGHIGDFRSDPAYKTRCNVSMDSGTIPPNVLCQDQCSENCVQREYW